jgi:hypothetical protein
LAVIDMLITKSNMEFQETMNYWKQTAQLMKYFRTDEDSRSHVPRDFMTGFLEVGVGGIGEEWENSMLIRRIGSQHLEWGKQVRAGRVCGAAYHYLQ